MGMTCQPYWTFGPGMGMGGGIRNRAIWYDVSFTPMYSPQLWFWGSRAKPHE